VSYNSVAIFIRLAVVASQIDDVAWPSKGPKAKVLWLAVPSAILASDSMASCFLMPTVLSSGRAIAAVLRPSSSSVCNGVYCG